MKTSKQLCCALITGLCFSTTSLTYADTLMYKWVDKNGIVTFSQNEPSEQQAREVTTITVQSMPESEQRAANRMLLNLKKENARFAAQQKHMKQADDNIEAALNQLKKAEHNYTTGSIPTGYDHVGNINHRARLRESYFERVSQLQDEVDRARQELNDAYTARDQIGPDSE